MKHYNLRDMVKGWFVGGFSPTAFFTDACEVAVKKYKAGDYEGAHFHKIGTEITLVLEGHVIMCSQKWGPGDIIIVEPGDITDFTAITDATNVVVKVPSVKNDKHLVV